MRPASPRRERPPGGPGGPLLRPPAPPPIAPPGDEAALLARARALAGRTVGQLAAALGQPVPESGLRGKGFVGRLAELALGATAGSRALPDFPALGVELKTVPVSPDGRPRESTFVCVARLAEAFARTWEDSPVREKLARVLWLPVEADAPLPEKRFGAAVLWSPSTAESAALADDWARLAALLAAGRAAEVTAHLGVCLQVRPKGASARAEVWAVDEEGEAVRAPTRGFYLRPAFVEAVLRRAYAPAPRAPATEER